MGHGRGTVCYELPTSSLQLPASYLPFPQPALYSPHGRRQMVMKRAHALSLVRQALAWTAAVAALGALFFGMQTAVASSGEWAARFLAPPIYPGSVRVSYQRTALPGYVQEMSNYETPDDVDTVVAYYSAHYVPAFAPDAMYTTWRQTY